MAETDQDFYQKLRKQVKEWSEGETHRSYRWTRWILIAPDLFHLLIRLSADPEVPVKEKSRVALVIAYFILPLDLLPELILGPMGFIDDIVLSAYALNALINHVDPSILRRHWAGEEDVLEVIQNVLRFADRMLGSGLFRRLKRILH